MALRPEFDDVDIIDFAQLSSRVRTDRSLRKRSFESANQRFTVVGGPAPPKRGRLIGPRPPARGRRVSYGPPPAFGPQNHGRGHAGQGSSGSGNLARPLADADDDEFND
jgi:hypothetical protein